MKLQIADIGEEGLHFERDLDDAAVRDLLAGGDVELLEGETSARLGLYLMRNESTVFVRGSITGSFTIACSRCLKPAAVDLRDDKVALTYLPKEAFAVEGEEIELDVDDLDTYAHDGETIDLGELLREHLLLAVPIAPLCEEGCPGIAVDGPANGAAEADAAPKSAWKAQLQALKGSLPSDKDSD